MKTESLRFEKTVFWFILICLMMFSMTGCGGCGDTSQKKMMRYAIRRPKDDEEKPAEKKPDPKQKDKQPTLPAATPDKPADKSAKDDATQTVKTPGGDGKPVAPVNTNRRPSESVEQRRWQTLANMRRIGQALEEYLRKNRYYPPYAIHHPQTKQPLLSWRVELLPFLGHEVLYHEFRRDEPWDSPHNKALLAKIPPVYQSPERLDDKTNYLVPFGSSTVFYGPRGTVRRDIEDGAANTVLVLEVDDREAVPWTKPQELVIRRDTPRRGLGKLRADGFFVVWGGGLVGRIPPHLPDRKIWPMYSKDGGEPFTFSQISQAATPEPAKMEAKTPVDQVAAKATDINPTNSAPTPKGDGDSSGTSAETPFDEAADGLSEELSAAAKDMFARKRERDAMQLHYAALLTRPAGDSWHKAMRWSPALKRPLLAVRWGIGVQLTAPSNFRGDPKPVDDGNGYKNGGHTASAKFESMQDFLRVTGQPGRWLLYRLQGEVAEGFWGDIPSGDIPSTLSSQNPSTVSRLNQGGEENFGPPRHAKPIAPGLTNVGFGSRKVLLHIAREEGLDMLAIFEVKIKQLRKLVHNTAELHLVDVQTGKTLYSSRSYNNIQVYAARRDPLEKDPMQEIYSKLGEFLDEQICLQELPENLRPEHARRRVQSLDLRRDENPLWALVEVRFYRDRGLIAEIELGQAYRLLLGDEQGKALHSSDPVQQARVLSKFVESRLWMR